MAVTDSAINPPPLADIARLTTAIGRGLMQAGATTDVVHSSIIDAAKGLGCTDAEVYAQHAALIVTLRRRGESYTHMGKVGEHGTNLRIASSLRKLVEHIQDGTLDLAAAKKVLKDVPNTTKKYPVWVVALATGLACAGFGRLILSDWRVEWVVFIPTCLGTAVGQWLRHTMLHKHLNFYLMVTSVAFTSAFIAGLGSRLVHSSKWELATVAATLLLVPGTAMFNAQLDILHGKPSLAAARVVRIMFILLFLSLGLILAQRIISLIPLP